MKKHLFVPAALIAISTVSFNAQADAKGKIDAKAEFEKHCASCHPNGGNIVNASKTIGKMALEANGIKGAKDIMAKMRNPGPGMTRFEKKEISDREAKAIAEYILKTFK